MGTAPDAPPWHQRFTAAETTEERGLYGALADVRRRTVLTVLRERDTPIAESQLARVLAAREASDTPAAITTADHERVQLSLHHVHLPHLEAVGLVERTDDDHLDCTQHSFWNTSPVRTVLTRDDIAPDVMTVTFDVLADERRRAILTLLKVKQELSMGEIATALAEIRLSGQELPSLAIELLHHHLPKLADAGVVDVDWSESCVRYTGNSVLDGWFGNVRSQQEA